MVLPRCSTQVFDVRCLEKVFDGNLLNEDIIRYGRGVFFCSDDLSFPGLVLYAEFAEKLGNGRFNMAQ